MSHPESESPAPGYAEGASEHHLPPLETITDIAEIDRVTADAVEYTEALLVTSEHPTAEFVQAALDEELCAALQEMLRSPGSGSLETVQSFLETAAKLADYRDGDESQAEFVEEFFADRRAVVLDTLDMVESSRFSRKEIAEIHMLDVTSDDDQTSIDAMELKYRKLSSFRHVDTSQSEAAGHDAEHAKPRSEQLPYELPPTDSQGKLFKYERENFSEYNPARIDQLKAFIDAQIKVHREKLTQARHTNPEANFVDTVGGVLGNGGKAVEFLAQHIATRDGRPMSADEMFSSSFADLAARYLEMDVAESDPAYDRDFRRR